MMHVESSESSESSTNNNKDYNSQKGTSCVGEKRKSSLFPADDECFCLKQIREKHRSASLYSPPSEACGVSSGSGSFCRGEEERQKEREQEERQKEGEEGEKEKEEREEDGSSEGSSKSSSCSSCSSSSCSNSCSNGGAIQGTSQDDVVSLELSWWQFLMLTLMIVLLLSSTVSFIAQQCSSSSSSPFFLFTWASNWNPIKKLLRHRNKAFLRMQVLAAQYERKCQERSRIAPLWFFARQAGNTHELESLRNRAIANEKSLRKIRRRYAKERAECKPAAGWLFLIRRAFWGSSDEREESKSVHVSFSSPSISSSSSSSFSFSDSSALSASTVESLVQSRIRLEEKRDNSVVAGGDKGVLEEREEKEEKGDREEDRDEKECCFVDGEREEKDTNSREAMMSRPLKEREVSEGNSKMTQVLESDEEKKKETGNHDIDLDGLYIQLPASLRESQKLSHKLNQLSQRKIGNLRKIFGKNIQQQKKETIDQEPADQGKSPRRSQEGGIDSQRE